MEANALLIRPGERTVKVELKVSTCVLHAYLCFAATTATEVLFPFLGTARYRSRGVGASVDSSLNFAGGGRVLYLWCFYKFCWGR